MPRATPTTGWSSSGGRLFPGVVYRHIVLTVPKYLRLWFYRNPQLLSPLMRAGHACLRDVFSTCSHVDLDIGSVSVLQTNGRPGNYNPHLHILVTSGGSDPQGRWKKLSFIPFDMLHRTWQYHLLTMLRAQVDDPTIEQDIDHGFTAYPKGFVANVQPGDVPPGGKGLAAYLAKYLVSPPISIHRIERYDGQTVRYWYRDHRTQSIQHERLPVLRFIGRMVQHILPKGFHRIRYYGLHSHLRYEAVRQQLAALLRFDASTDPSGYRVVPRKPFAQRFTETFGTDPLRCPTCGDSMDLELIYHPDYGTIADFRASGWESPDDRQTPDRLRRIRGSGPAPGTTTVAGGVTTWTGSRTLSSTRFLPPNRAGGRSCIAPNAGETLSGTNPSPSSGPSTIRTRRIFV